MITKTKQIGKGVKLVYVNTKKFKTNYVSINFVSPLSKERTFYNSILPSVLMRGTSKYPSQIDLNKKLQYLYSVDIGSRNVSFGEYHVFGFKANMLNNRFARELDIEAETVDLLCEMILNPYLVDGAFDKTYTEGEKISLIDAIEATINDKGRYATTRLLSEMCKDEIFGIPKLGTVDDVNTITPSSLYSYYEKSIKTLPIEIYFVGDGDFDKIANKFEEAFSKIDREPITIPISKVITEVSEIKEIEEIENVKQGKLAMGFRTGYKPEYNKYHLLQLFNEIFGASPTAKLFVNVREKLSLCYYCRSSVAQRTGLMLVSSGVDAKNKETAKQAIIEQLNAVKNGEITEEELESAKKSLINGYMQIYDSAESMESWILFRGLCGIKTTPKMEIEKVAVTTKEEIQEISKGIKLDTVYFLKGKESKNG